MERRGFIATLLGLTANSSDARTGSKVVWVVPFAPGGGTDLFVRPLIDVLGAVGPDEYIVDYRPGAGGRIGARIAARSEANGQTVFVGSVHHVVGQVLYPADSAALLSAFEPVIRIASVPDILVVPSSIGVTDIAGLVSYAASHSTSMAFASSGMGTARHVLGEAFNQAHSLRAVHVPYSGSGPAINSLLAAEVHYMFEGIGPALPHIRSGALRALAVSQKRVPSLPGVPSFKEVGIEALSASSWYGVFLPRRAAHTLVTNLNERIAQALDSEALRSNWRRNNADYLPHSPLEFSAFIHEELLHWNSLVKAAGVVVG